MSTVEGSEVLSPRLVETPTPSERVSSAVGDALPWYGQNAAAPRPGTRQRSILVIGSFRLMCQCIAQALRERMPWADVTEIDPDLSEIPQLVERSDIVLLIAGGASVTDDAVRAQIETIQRVHAESRTMIVSSCQEEAITLSLFKTGLGGVFLTDSGLDLLVPAVSLLLAGGLYIPAHLLTTLGRQDSPSRRAT